MELWQHRRGPHALAQLLQQRWEALQHRFDFGRTLLLRRAVAAVLVVVAAVLALMPGPASSADDAVVVAARDLAAGTVLRQARSPCAGYPNRWYLTAPFGFRPRCWAGRWPHRSAVVNR